MPTTEIHDGLSFSPGADERGYRPPPPPPAPFRPPPVTANAAKAEGTVLEQAHAAMLHAKAEFQKHIDKTNENKHPTPLRGTETRSRAFRTPTQPRRSIRPSRT